MILLQVVSIINHVVIGVICTNLAVVWGPHFVNIVWVVVAPHHARFVLYSRLPKFCMFDWNTISTNVESTL